MDGKRHSLFGEYVKKGQIYINPLIAGVLADALEFLERG